MYYNLETKTFIGVSIVTALTVVCRLVFHHIFGLTYDKQQTIKRFDPGMTNNLKVWPRNAAAVIYVQAVGITVHKRKDKNDTTKPNICRAQARLPKGTSCRVQTRSYIEWSFFPNTS